MAKQKKCMILTMFFIVLISMESEAKQFERSKNEINGSAEAKVTKHFVKSTRKPTDGAAILFVDELKVTLERYLFGICPQTFKISLGRGKNASTPLPCDLDTEQHDLAGRLATLALRAHAASRGDCSRLADALASTLGELARTATNRHDTAAANAEANKKRKLSKSQKAKLQAKQRTALLVKKKAAAAAAAKPVSS